MVLWIAYNGHFDPEALCYRALRDCFRRVVRPFRVHIRPELLEQGLDVRFWKQNDVIHVLDRRDQFGAGLLIENRSPGSFEAADAGVGIYTHHQKISFFLCTCEVPNMTDVQSIKTSVRKNEATSVALGFLEQRFELASLHDFGVGLPHTLSDGPQSRLPDRVLQFLTRDGCCSSLHHHKAAGNVGDVSGLEGRRTAGQPSVYAARTVSPAPVTSTA